MRRRALQQSSGYRQGLEQRTRVSLRADSKLADRRWSWHRWGGILGTLSVAAGLTAGCGGNQAPNATVTGLVTLDSKPLDKGIITFVSAAEDTSTPATGQIQQDGSYRVQIGLTGRVVAGEYLVSVASRYPPIASPNGGPPSPGPLLTPERYSTVTTSGLRYNIRPGTNIIDIPLASIEQEMAEPSPVPPTEAAPGKMVPTSNDEVSLDPSGGSQPRANQPEVTQGSSPSVNPESE